MLHECTRNNILYVGPFVRLRFAQKFGISTGNVELAKCQIGVSRKRRGENSDPWKYLMKNVGFENSKSPRVGLMEK